MLDLEANPLAAKTRTYIRIFLWKKFQRLDDLDDLVQETLIALWKNHYRFDPARGTYLSFVNQVARNTAIDYWRKNSKHGSNRVDFDDFSVMQIPDAAPRPGDEFSNREQARLALASLEGDANNPPTRYMMRAQQILPLNLDDVPHRTLAEMFGVPLGTIKSTIRLGLERMREALESANAGA